MSVGIVKILDTEVKDFKLGYSYTFIIPLR